jgi:phosphoserine phosphatase RsbX
MAKRQPRKKMSHAGIKPTWAPAAQTQLEPEADVFEPLIAWGVAVRALPGQQVSGDKHLVTPVGKGFLLAVVAGVGHGEEASAAAKTAVAVLEEHAGEPLPTLFKRCHAALTRSRGVVMTVAALQPGEGRLTWMGVGNVEALVVRAETGRKTAGDRAVLRSGLVGYQLPEQRANVLPIAPGDLVAFATDGIGPGFSKELVCGESPQKLANDILERHFKGNDDALALVVRYLGVDHE